LKPQGYRVRVAFPDATALAVQADVRIAGVNVGKVVGKQVDPVGNRTVATLEFESQYAPIHVDATAILRQKTLLGETYVELSPGSPTSKPLPDNGVLGRARVQGAVQISQIFDALDPATRRALQIFSQELAAAVAGNQQSLSNALGNLPTFAADAGDVLKVLDVEHAAVVSLVENGGTVFNALGHHQTALRNLILSAESVFSRTATDRTALADTVRVLPTFLDEARTTMARLQRFATDADPVIRQLDLVARDLGPTLQALRALSPSVRTLFVKLVPLIDDATTGLPAYADVIHGATPLLRAVGTLLEQLNSILHWLDLHQRLLSDFISNGGYGIAAKTTAFGGAGLTCSGVPCGHYLRQFGPTGPETFGTYQNRDANNRGNTYPPPLWLGNPEVGKRQTLPAWDCVNAGGEHPPSGNQQAWWIASTLPGASGLYRIPHITAIAYSKR
jgi:virulence factor Mce-like protein